MLEDWVLGRGSSCMGSLCCHSAERRRQVLLWVQIQPPAHWLCVASEEITSRRVCLLCKVRGEGSSLRAVVGSTVTPFGKDVACVMTPSGWAPACDVRDTTGGTRPREKTGLLVGAGDAHAAAGSSAQGASGPGPVSGHGRCCSHCARGPAMCQAGALYAFWGLMSHMEGGIIPFCSPAPGTWN